MKKLLIPGAGNAQEDLIEYARNAGFETYGCSYTDTDKGIALLDHFVQIDIADVKSVENYVIENGIDYIYSIGSDIAVPTICEAAEKTGLFHFVSSRTAKLCRSKHKIRETLGENSRFNVPYIVCRTLSEAEKADFYPLVIKPVDSQGQRGVYCVSDYNELSECFYEAMSFSKSRQVILEKYISGKEVSVNAYVKDGSIIFSMLSDRKSFDSLPGGIVSSHHIPSVFENTQTHKEINELVKETVKKFEIDNGPVYFQIKICDKHPYLIEVAPRLDGCHIWRMIKEYCGVNLLELAVNHLSGRDIKLESHETSSVPVHLEFFCEPPDTVFDAGKYENLPYDFRKMYYQTGEKVKK